MQCNPCTALWHSNFGHEAPFHSPAAPLARAGISSVQKGEKGTPSKKAASRLTDGTQAQFLSQQAYRHLVAHNSLPISAKTRASIYSDGRSTTNNRIYEKLLFALPPAFASFPSAPKTLIHKPAAWAVDPSSLEAEPYRNSFLTRKLPKTEMGHSKQVIPCNLNGLDTPASKVPRSLSNYKASSLSPFMPFHREKEGNNKEKKKKNVREKKEEQKGGPPARRFKDKYWRPNSYSAFAADLDQRARHSSSIHAPASTDLMVWNGTARSYVNQTYLHRYRIP